METLTGRGRLADRGRRLLAGASPKGHMDGNAGVAAGAPGRGGATNPADRMPLGKREGAGWRNPKVVRLEERRTQKGKATFFRSMSGPGPHGPPDVALPGYGDAPKRYRRNNTERVILSVFGRCLVLHPKSRYQRRGPSSG